MTLKKQTTVSQIIIVSYFLYPVLFIFSCFFGEVLYFAALMPYLVLHLASQCN